MKRAALIVTATLLALALLITPAVLISRQIKNTETAVTLTEEPLFGDRAYADGVTLRLHTILNDHTLHRTTVTLGATDATTHIDDVAAYYGLREIPRANLKDYNEPDTILYTPSSYLENALETFPIYTAMQAEARATGNPVTRTIKLADYFSALPLVGFLEPIFGYDIQVSPTLTPSDPDYPGSWQEAADNLAAAIRIPVDETWQATVTLTYNEERDDDDCDFTSDSPLPHLYGHAVRTADAIYFYLSARYCTVFGHTDRYLPFSDDALGLYKIPLDPTQSGPATLRIDQMTRVFAPAESLNILRVYHDQTTGHIHLLEYTHDPATDEGDYTLHTINPATGACLASLPLLHATPDPQGYGQIYHLTLAEDYAVFRVHTAGILLLDRNPDGTLSPNMTILHKDKETDPNLQNVLYWLGNFTTYSYRLSYDRHKTPDGRTRLAILYTEPTAAGFRIAVFEDGTLVYHARYTASLSPLLKDPPIVHTWFDYSFHDHGWYTSDNVPTDYFDDDQLFN